MDLQEISSYQDVTVVEASEVSEACGHVRLEAEDVGPVGGGHLSGLRLAFLGFAFLLPLAVLPGLEQPFSRPKLILLAIVIPGGLLILARRLGMAWRGFPRALRIALKIWLGAVGASAVLGEFASPESLILALLGVGWLVLLIAVRPQPERLAWALVFSGSVIAALALAQFGHTDPFSLLGWIPLENGVARMRVFATLGNPNFVAAFLAGLLPLTFSLADKVGKHRRLLSGLFVLQALAILATGSRAPILALAAAVLWMASSRGSKWWGTFGLAVLGIVVIAAIFSPARDLKTTLRGRAYIWKISAPHLADHPLLGLGPGGFAAAYPAWETQKWQAAPGSEIDRMFIGAEDHAHNDYLEILADYGAIGLLAWGATLFVFLRTAWFRARAGGSRLVLGASAGVIALAAVALVDFPFMRPAEVFLLWSLMAVSLLSEGTEAGYRKIRLGT